MADLETSVVISAQTDGLQSGMEAASNSVQIATEGMKAQFAGLGAVAQQAQAQISTAAAQIGSTIGALQTRVASLAGSIGSGMTTTFPDPDSRGGSQGFPSSQQQRAGGLGGELSTTAARSTGGASALGAGDNRLHQWRAELQNQLHNEQAFFRDFQSRGIGLLARKVGAHGGGIESAPRCRNQYISAGEATRGSERARYSLDARCRRKGV